MQDCFNNQIDRLNSAGYPGAVIVAVAKMLLKKVKGMKKAKDNRGPEKTDVIPYMHRVSHNMKEVAERYGISIAFSAPCKLARMCSRIPGEHKKGGCGKKHSHRYVECAVGVVYEIPLSCGRSYVGQTGRCVNDRAREHELSIGKIQGAHLATHCLSCCCEPRFKEIKILKKSKSKDARELVEAYYIKRKGSACVSDTSITLYDSEMGFLQEVM